MIKNFWKLFPNQRTWILLLSPFLFQFVISCVKPDRVQVDNSRQEYSLTESLNDFNNRALFQAGVIDLFDVELSYEENKSDWQQGNHIEMWFRICNIRDRASAGMLVGQKFNIRSDLGEHIKWDDENRKIRLGNPVQVDSNSCLNWSQEIPVFDYLAKSVNLAIHYEIESISDNMGKIVRRVGFNPWDRFRQKARSGWFRDITSLRRAQWGQGEWAIGEKNLLDALEGELIPSGAKLGLRSLKVSPVETIFDYGDDLAKSHEDLLKDMTPEQRALRKGRLAEMACKEKGKTVEECKNEDKEENKNNEEEIEEKSRRGLFIDLNIEAVPFIRSGDSTEIPIDKALLTGRFQVFANIIASGVGDNKPQVLGSSRGSFVWSTDQYGLQMSIPVHLKYRSELGSVHLALKVVPMSRGINKLEPFTAVYRLGQWDSWVKSQKPQFAFGDNLRPLEGIDYDKYAGQINDECTKNTQTKGPIRCTKSFFLRSFRPRFVRIMPGETATDRTLQYKVEACFLDGLFGRKVGSGLQFQITTSDKGKDDVDERWTNNDGCLNWFGFLSHKYFRKEVLEKKVAKVKFLGSHINPFEDEYTYYMNPWDEKWTFGWDARDMPEGYPDDIKEQRDQAPDSKIFIPAFKYETMGFRYSIDRFLNLKVRKTVLLSLYAYTLKYNSIILGRGATEILRDGIYLMKVALQKDYRDPAASNKVKIRISDEGFENQNENVGDIIDQANKNLDQVDKKCKDSNNEYKECISQPNVEYTLLRPDEIRATANEGCVNSDNQETCLNKFAHENYPKCGILNLNFDNCMEEVFQDSAETFEDSNDETKRQSIAIQQKLVRVLGGRIITPIEFEMSDLRLMRLRNQLFIQLETIDENKLKLATRISDIFENWYDNHNFEKYYETIFDMLRMLGIPEQYEEFNKDWDKIFEENNICFILREIKTSLNNSDRDLFTDSFKKDWDQIFGNLEDDKICSRFKEVWANSKSEVGESSKSRDFKALERIISQIYVIYKDLKDTGDRQDINPIRDEVYELFGLNEDTPEYEKRKEEIHGFLNRMFRYQFYDLNERDSFKNERRRIINQYVENFGLQDEGYSDSTKIDENTYINADINNETSFFQRFMSPSSFNEDGFIKIVETVVEEKLNNDENFKKFTEEEKENLREEEIENFMNEMRASDFASTPLTPNFDFDLLSNAGRHEHLCDDEFSSEDCEDDGKSGLPARTFVGPLTLLFNTNTSHLRPTDILNEKYCQSAICDKWDELEFAKNGVPIEDLPEIDGNHFEVNGNALTMHGEDFQGVQGKSTSIEIFDARDSLNSSYENKYYGFLKDYFNKTVDDLIEEKRKLDKKQNLKMELDSQLINFVRSMRLKHVAISEDVDPDLRLREIDFSQCEKEGKLSKTCYSALDSGPEVLRKETFIEQLNGPPIRLSMPKELAEEIGRRFKATQGFGEPAKNLLNPDWIRFTDDDLYNFIKFKPGEQSYDFREHREFTYRMCTVLTRNLFSESFLPDYEEDYMPNNTDTLHDVRMKRKEISNKIKDGAEDGVIKLGEKSFGIDFAQRLLEEINKYELKLREIGDIEELCNRYVHNLYISKDQVCDSSLAETCTGERISSDRPNEEGIKYSPILFEKRMRVLETTGRYVYR